MKKLFVFCLILFASFSLNAQVRNFVCKVYPGYSKDNQKSLKEFSHDIEKYGLKDKSISADEYIKHSTYNSGFVYIDSDGYNYIITTWHNVESCENIYVEFTNESNINTGYKLQDLVGFNKELDIALFRFPDGINPFTKGIELYPGINFKNDIVYSAGYSSSDDEIYWQWSKGIIESSDEKVNSLLPDTKLLKVTSEVNVQNCGGPVIFQSGDNYYVVGMSVYRPTCNTPGNYAVPVKVIKDFLNSKYSNDIQPQSLDELKTQSEEFAKIMDTKNPDYSKINDYISTSYAIKRGGKILGEKRSLIDNEAWNVFSRYCSKGSPVDAMKYVVAFGIYDDFHKINNSTDYQIIISKPIRSKTPNEWTINYTIPGKEVRLLPTNWIYEKGCWKISSCGNKYKDSDSMLENIPSEKLTFMGNYTLYNPNTISLSNGISISVLGKGNDLFRQYATVERTIKNYLSVDGSILMNRYKRPIAHIDEQMYFYDSAALLAGAKGELPFFYYGFIYSPFVTLNFGLKLDNLPYLKVNPNFETQMDLGCRVHRYFKKKDNSLFVESGISLAVYTDLGGAGNLLKLDVAPFIGAGFGF